MTEIDHWSEVLDIIAELENDLKDNRRALRHLHSLTASFAMISIEIKGMTEVVKKKRGIF